MSSCLVVAEVPGTFLDSVPFRTSGCCGTLELMYSQESGLVGFELMWDSFELIKVVNELRVPCSRFRTCERLQCIVRKSAGQEMRIVVNK